MAALPSSPLVPLEEYLSTSYDPDVEYVDGVLVERNVGDWLHSLIQSNIKLMSVYRHPALHEVEGERIVSHDQQVWLSRGEIFSE